jgi:uncharacterized membrane protein
MSDEPEVTKVQETSIETVVRLEAEAEQRVSPTDRISEAIGSFAGTNYFILLQLACVSVWVLINTGALRVVSAFDPYPFPLLATLLALEGVLLAAFVLISQKRMSQRAEQRSHLDLQINLLAEKEVHQGDSTPAAHEPAYGSGRRTGRRRNQGAFKRYGGRGSRPRSSRKSRSR